MAPCWFVRANPVATVIDVEMLAGTGLTVTDAELTEVEQDAELFDRGVATVDVELTDERC